MEAYELKNASAFLPRHVPDVGSIRRSPAILHKKKDPGLLRTPGPSFIYGTVLFQILFSRSLLMEPFFSQPLHTARMRRSLSETGNVPGSFFHCEMIDCECSDKNDQRHRRG